MKWYMMLVLSVGIIAFCIGILMRSHGSLMVKAFYTMGPNTEHGLQGVVRASSATVRRHRNLCCERSGVRVMQWRSEVAQLRDAFHAKWHRERSNIDTVIHEEILVPEQSRLHAKTVRQVISAWHDVEMLLLSRFVGPEKINDNLRDILDLLQEYALYTDVGRLHRVIDCLENAKQAVIDGKYAKLVDSLKGIVHPLKKHKTDLGKAINRSIDRLVDKLYLGRDSLGRKAAENAYRVEAEREAIAEAVAKKVIEKTVIEHVVREAVAKEAARQAHEAQECQKAAQELSARMSY